MSSKKSAHQIILELSNNFNRLFELKEKWILKNSIHQWKQVTSNVSLVKEEDRKFDESAIVTDDPRSLHAVTTLTKLIESIVGKISPDEYSSLHQSIHDTIEYITRLEQEQHYLTQTHGSLPSLPYNSYQHLEHSNTAGEIRILQEYHEKLLAQINSLERQLQFVKQQKEKSDTVHLENTQRLVRQLHTLNNLLQKAKEEKEVYYQEVIEKERALEVTLVHLTTAHEEIKKIAHSRLQSKAIEHKEVQEFLQQHSKYSSQQFIKLSSQVDAMRQELFLERNARSQEKLLFHDELTKCHSKITTYEAMIENLQLQLTVLSNSTRDVAENVSQSGNSRFGMSLGSAGMPSSPSRKQFSEGKASSTKKSARKASNPNGEKSPWDVIIQPNTSMISAATHMTSSSTIRSIRNKHFLSVDDSQLPTPSKSSIGTTPKRSGTPTTNTSRGHNGTPTRHSTGNIQQVTMRGRSESPNFKTNRSRITQRLEQLQPDLHPTNGSMFEFMRDNTRYASKERHNNQQQHPNQHHDNNNHQFYDETDTPNKGDYRLKGVKSLQERLQSTMTPNRFDYSVQYDDNTHSIHHHHHHHQDNSYQTVSATNGHNNVPPIRDINDLSEQISHLLQYNMISLPQLHTLLSHLSNTATSTVHHHVLTTSNGGSGNTKKKQMIITQDMGCQTGPMIPTYRLEIPVTFDGTGLDTPGMHAIDTTTTSTDAVGTLMEPKIPILLEHTAPPVSYNDSSENPLYHTAATGISRNSSVNQMSMIQQQDNPFFASNNHHNSTPPQPTVNDDLVPMETLQRLVHVYNSMTNDYNNLLSTYNHIHGDYKTLHDTYSTLQNDYKEEISQNTQQIHNLQTAHNALALENEHLHTNLLLYQQAQEEADAAAEAEAEALLEAEENASQHTGSSASRQMMVLDGYVSSIEGNEEERSQHTIEEEDEEEDDDHHHPSTHTSSSHRKKDSMTRNEESSRKQKSIKATPRTDDSAIRKVSSSNRQYAGHTPMATNHHYQQLALHGNQKQMKNLRYEQNEESGIATVDRSQGTNGGGSSRRNKEKYPRETDDMMLVNDRRVQEEKDRDSDPSSHGSSSVVGNSHLIRGITPLIIPPPNYPTEITISEEHDSNEDDDEDTWISTNERILPPISTSEMGVNTTSSIPTHIPTSAHVNTTTTTATTPSQRTSAPNTAGSLHSVKSSFATSPVKSVKKVGTPVGTTAGKNTVLTPRKTGGNTTPTTAMPLVMEFRLPFDTPSTSEHNNPVDENTTGKAASSTQPPHNHDSLSMEELLSQWKDTLFTISLNYATNPSLTSVSPAKTPRGNHIIPATPKSTTTTTTKDAAGNNVFGVYGKVWCRVAHLQQIHQSLSEIYHQLQDQLATMEKKLLTAQTENMTTSMQVSHLQQQLIDKDMVLHTLQDHHTTVSKQLSAVESHFSALQEQHTVHQQQVRDSAVTVTKQQQELTTQLHKLQQEYAELSEKHVQMIRTHQDAIQVQQEKYNAQQVALLEKEGKLKEKEEFLEIQRHSLEEHAEKEAKLVVTKQQLLDEVGNMRRKIGDYEQQQDEERSAAASLSGEDDNEDRFPAPSSSSYRPNYDEKRQYAPQSQSQQQDGYGSGHSSDDKHSQDSLAQILLKGEQRGYPQQNHSSQSHYSTGSTTNMNRYEQQQQPQSHPQNHRTYEEDTMDNNNIPRPPPITISHSPRRLRSHSQSNNSSVYGGNSPRKTHQSVDQQPLRREGSRSPNRQLYESRISRSGSVDHHSTPSYDRRRRTDEEIEYTQQQRRQRRDEDYDKDEEDYEEEDENTFNGNSTIGTAPTPTNWNSNNNNKSSNSNRNSNSSYDHARGRNTSRDRIQPSTTTTSVKSSTHQQQQYASSSNARSPSRYAIIDHEEQQSQRDRDRRRDSSPDYKQDLQYIKHSVDMVEHQQPHQQQGPGSPSRNTGMSSTRAKYFPPPPPTSQYPPLPSHLLDTTNPLSASNGGGVGIGGYRSTVNSSVQNLFADTFSSSTNTNINTTSNNAIGASMTTNPLYFSTGTAPGSSGGSLLFPRIEELLVNKKELEDRLTNAEMKYTILQAQIQSMPASINIAHAEKRVLEGKLAKASEAYEINIQRIQQHAISKIKEVETFLELEKNEKMKLIEQLKENQQTIHQLTHHMKLLQSNGASTNGGQQSSINHLVGYATSGSNNNNSSSSMLTTNPKNGQYYQAAPEYTLRASYPPANHTPTTAPLLSTTNFLFQPTMKHVQQQQEDEKYRPVELEIPPAPWEATALPTPTNHHRTNTNTITNTTHKPTAMTGITTRMPTTYY